MGSNRFSAQQEPQGRSLRLGSIRLRLSFDGLCDLSPGGLGRCSRGSFGGGCLATLVRCVGTRVDGAGDVAGAGGGVATPAGPPVAVVAALGDGAAGAGFDLGPRAGDDFAGGTGVGFELLVAAGV